MANQVLLHNFLLVLRRHDHERQLYLKLPLANRRDGDCRNEGWGAFEFGIAFGNNPDSGKFIFAELVGEESESPAEDDYIGGGERE